MIVKNLLEFCDEILIHRFICEFRVIKVRLIHRATLSHPVNRNIGESFYCSAKYRKNKGMVSIPLKKLNKG